VIPVRYFLRISDSLKVHIKPSMNMQLLTIFMPSKKGLAFSVTEQCNYSMKLSLWRQPFENAVVEFSLGMPLMNCK